MVKDYSANGVVNRSRKKITNCKKSRSKASDLSSASKLMWKTLGAMLLVTVVVGISSSVWYGWQVQLALDQIGQSRIKNIELTNENRLLIAQHDLMLTRKSMENAAGKIGLYAPKKNQLRHP